MSLQAKTLTPEHIRQHICADPRLSFLHDLANKMATGPNNTARSLSTSSASSTPISLTRPSFQAQLSVAYQDPAPLSSTAASNTTNLLFINQPLSRSYSNSLCTKVKPSKRTFDLVEEDPEDDDDDEEDEDEDEDEDDNDNSGGNAHSKPFIAQQRIT